MLALVTSLVMINMVAVVVAVVVAVAVAAVIANNSDDRISDLEPTKSHSDYSLWDLKPHHSDTWRL